jgi:tripartite-type tricarboxylate transporter receptor subunit TctC
LSHLTAALFLQQARIDMLHVPYKGAAPAVVAAAAGEVPVIFSAYPSVSGQAQAGKLRMLAVTSAKRIAAAPALPTIAEAALPGFESTQWWGLYAPARLAPEVLARLNREMNSVLKTDDTKQRLATEGAEPAGGTPADLAAHHKADYERWEKVIRTAGIKGE